MYEYSLPSSQRLQAVKDYIKQTWTTLTRSRSHILEAAKDSKIDLPPGQRPVVYISPKEDFEAIEREIKEAVGSAEFEQIELRVLHAEVEHIDVHGLLYLPHDYVVPGGRFNEMYGWDSYFIFLGLLRDGELHLAQNMVEQFVYEIEHYGTILNANRTYMLTRSQPPFFTPMAVKFYEYIQDREWLGRMLHAAENHYYYWIVPPHLNQITGLSRYYDLGEGPAPEVISSERDEGGRTHYDRICEYYRTHAIDDYDVSLYYDDRHDSLTDLFFKGDRSMRESGLDPTNRFGPFSIDIIHYAPVCLNVLLYQMERDLEQMNEILGHSDSVTFWRNRAIARHELIDKFLWDEERGMYYDYNFATERRRHYDYLTTFFPLWTGMASKAQAARVMENLPKFETKGGLRVSCQVTGNQWDAPFGWAPLHLISVLGMLRYGYREDARRIAAKFITLLVQEFERSGTLWEKYDVESCSGNVSEEILFGYNTNEIGFGWTNAVFLELLDILESDRL